MISTSIQDDATSSAIARMHRAVRSFVVNPLGWRRHANVHLTWVATSPRIPLFGSWYLEATRENLSADVELQIDRFGRRRCRVMRLDGVSRREVRESPMYEVAKAWVVSGDDQMLRRATSGA